MRSPKVILTFLAISLMATSALPVSSVFAAKPSTLCNTSWFGLGSGAYGAKGGAFVEDIAGELEWCSGGGNSAVVAYPPGPFTSNYYSIAGVQTSIGLVLAMVENDGHVWFCFEATSSGCAVQSNLITIPYAVSFYGAALDSKLNLYVADQDADGIGGVDECFASTKYQSCTAIFDLSSTVTGLYRFNNGTILDTDSGCAGLVWRNGAIVAEMPTGADSITVSKLNPTGKPHIYVALNGGCGSSSKPGIFDMTDAKSLPTLNTGTDNFYGLTPFLQYVDFSSGAVYQVKDKI